MPVWLIIAAFAWFVVAVVIVALFRGGALLSRWSGREMRNLAPADPPPEGMAPIGGLSNCGETRRPSGRRGGEHGGAQSGGATRETIGSHLP